MYDIEIKKGHTFRYDIWFGGEPPPTVTWEREGAQVQADQRITIELFSKKTVYCERNTVLTVKKVGAVNYIHTIQDSYSIPISFSFRLIDKRIRVYTRFD